MAVLVSAHAALIQRRLSSGSIGRYNFLSGAIDATQTTITVTDDVTGIVSGSKLGIDTEILLVRGTPDPTTKAVTVVRGFLGSTAAAHADQALIEVGPRFPLADIIDTMREEIRSWSPTLFQVRTATIGTSPDLRDYNLTGATSPLFLLELTIALTQVTATENAHGNYRAVLVRNQDVTQFPSGTLLQLRNRPGAAYTMIAVWAEDFVVDPTFTTGTDLVGDCGIGLSMLDVLTYGTMWRLMSNKEVARTDLHASGETRKAAEVPPGYSSQTAAALMNLRNRRLADEANTLRSLYPFRWL